MKSVGLVAVSLVTAVASFGSISRADIITHAYTGWDSPGGDFDSFLSGTQQNCSQICLERGNCTAAEFNQADGRCWIKNVTTGFVRADAGILILKILSARDGIDYPGGDYRNYQTTSWQNCSRACYVESQCRAFTFDKVTNTCWLKNAIVDAAFVPAGVSGRK